MKSPTIHAAMYGGASSGITAGYTAVPVAAPVTARWNVVPSDGADRNNGSEAAASLKESLERSG